MESQKNRVDSAVDSAESWNLRGGFCVIYIRFLRGILKRRILPHLCGISPWNLAIKDFILFLLQSHF